VEHPLLAKTRGKDKLFLYDLAKRVNVPDKTSPKIDEAEANQGSHKGVPN
jgi:hypothetical protein